MKLLRSRESLAGSRDGTASIEFAILMPVLVTMMMGTYELANLYNANSKITAATQTAADLVAQTSTGTTLTGANLTTISNAAAQVLTPLPASTLSIAYASIIYKNNAPTIDWTYEWPNDGSAAATAAQGLTISTVPAVVKGLVTSADDSVIMVVAQYKYTSPISYVLSKTYTFTEYSYDKPRYQTNIPCNNTQPGQTCP